MSIRECALNNKAFATLKEAYDNRDAVAKKWHDSGKKVIGELGCDVPDEYVIAGGMLPIHVYADIAKPLVQTDTYLEYAFDPVVRAQFEKIVDGTYDNLIDALFISNSTDVIIRIYLYLRELHRVEPEKPIPPVEFIDWLFTRNRMHQVRNEHTLKLCLESIEKYAGHKITDDEIVKAAKICNADRAALRKIGALRHGEEVHINGSEALVIIGSAFFMEREEHTSLVEQVAADAAGWPVVEGPRVFLTGSNQEHTDLYDKIEESGMVIVGEDHDWGDRYYNRDYNTNYSHIRAIVDCYMLREFSSKKAFVSQRVAALDREVTATDADAVIFYTNIYEEAASWDYPSQKASLEGRGIKTACFSKMAWPVEKNADLDEKLKSFADTLKGGAR